MMKIISIFAVLFLFYSADNFAQGKFNSITDKPDTSYTVYSAAKKMHKKYPEAVLVADKLPSGVKVKKGIVFEKIGTKSLHLNIYFPERRADRLYPGVLMIHGGGWRSGNIQLAVPMAERLAAKGYVTVTPEYRLSTEALYPAAVYDLKTAVRWMRANWEEYGIDTNKIAAYGCSAGGQLSAFMGTTNGDKKYEGEGGYVNHSSIVQAVIDVDGVVDFFGKESEEVVKKSGKPSAAALWFGVPAKDDSAVWKDAGAINHLTKDAPPIIFINSAVPRFHAGRDAMINLLKKYKIYYEVHTLPNTIHTFWLFKPWFKQTFDYTVNFLNKTFK